MADPLFEDVTARVGLDFVHDAGPLSHYQLPQITGSGCAFVDFDQDGLLDIFVVNHAGGGCYPGMTDPPLPDAAVPTHRLYCQGGDGRFRDVTRGSGVDVVGVGMGVAVGDVNNDGFPDLYLACYGPGHLFLNRRDGTFVDITESAGVDNPLWGTACAFVDYDRDGWLDLFVANYVDYHPATRCDAVTGGQEFCRPAVFEALPARLYRNESGRIVACAVPSGEAGENGVRFRDVSLASGIGRKAGMGLGVVAADFDGDRWPDLFVANDGAANFLWINRHDGTFAEEAVLRGAAYDLTGRAQSNMGIAIGDVDQDGRLDLLVTHLDGEANALYLNKSAGEFEESAGPAGLGRPSLPYTSWGTAFFDVDHDGNLDLAVVNGRIARVKAAPMPIETPANRSSSGGGWEAYAESNQFFLNDGTGHFIERNAKTEPFCALPAIGRGLAVGDVDNDGDLDLLVTNVAGPARLFRNVARKQGHWLEIRAVEPALGGRDACGALVTLVAKNRRWVQNVNPAYSYLSSNDPRLHFGLGNVDRYDSILVVWADGVEEHFSGGAVDRQIVIRRGEGHVP